MVPKLAQLHEEYIDQARRPMSLGRAPISAREPAPIIVPLDRWEETSAGLSKTFKFRRGEDRVRFVIELLEYEEQVQHHAEMLVKEDTVSLKLITKNLDKVTESDREYKAYADSVFKDLVYSP